jgi:hypothetical protein
MRIALAMLIIPFLAPAASLMGTVIDQTGAYVPHAAVELASGSNNYRVQADDAGVFQFLNLPAGEFTLTIRVPGFKVRTIKSMALFEREQKRVPDITLDIGSVASCGGEPSRDLLLLPLGTLFGRLTGSVAPPLAAAEVTLVCRTFNACASTKTDSNGRYSFDMLPAGYYGLNFRREGFYPVNATGYSYYVSAGWESVYSPVMLENCPNGNCNPKRRPKRPVGPCE